MLGGLSSILPRAKASVALGGLNSNVVVADSSRPANDCPRDSPVERETPNVLP
jgi:hypothetical protein